ncbi:MAG: Spx/MgsR family RNA polymerase-binding regulatory protein [Moraxella sp.]|nr:Spx/MgsR family RNA polymerase-binding regulatory protein [Moraxella sp.]
MITVYGIKNCNTMKKCFEYLEQHGIDYAFVDYKKAQVGDETLQAWTEDFGLDKLINKQGTTYKKLTDEDKAIINQAIENKQVLAIADMIRAHQSMIKRPIVTGAHQETQVALIGFDVAAFDKVFSASSL